MTDTVLKRRSALDGHWQAGTSGAVGPVGPGITLSLRTPLSMVQVDAWNTLSDIAGQALPTPVKAVEDATGRAILNTGPNRYLVVEPETDDLLATLETALGDTAALTGQGHARTVWRITGPNLRDLLAKGTTVDVDRMAPGDCIVTLLGHFSTILHCRTDDSADLYAARSYAVDVHHWLVESSLEFGLTLD